MSYQYDSDAPWYKRWSGKLVYTCFEQGVKAWTPSPNKMFWGLMDKPTHKGQWGRRFLNGLWDTVALPFRFGAAVVRTAGAITVGVLGLTAIGTGVCTVHGILEGTGKILAAPFREGWADVGEGLLRIVGGGVGLAGIGIAVGLSVVTNGALPALVIGAATAITSVGGVIHSTIETDKNYRDLADAPPPDKSKPGIFQRIKNAISRDNTAKATVQNAAKLANTNTATRTAAVGATVAGVAAVAHAVAKPAANTAAAKPAHTAAPATQAQPATHIARAPTTQKPSAPGQSQTAAASPLGASMGALNAKAKGLTASNADPSTQQPGVRHMQANANAAPGADKTLTPTTPAIGPPTKIEAYNPKLQEQFGAKIEHDSKLKTDVIRGRDVAGALDFAEKHELIPPGKQYVLRVPITATRPPERAMELANDIIAKMPAGKVTHVQIGDTKHEVILGVDGKNQMKKPEAAAVAQQPPSPAERRPSI